MYHKINSEYSYQGEIRTLSEWCESDANKYRLRYSTLSRRIQRGLTIQQALENPPKNTGGRSKTFYPGFDLSLSISEWADSPHNVHGLSVDAIRRRLLKNPSIELALGTPLQTSLQSAILQAYRSDRNIHGLSMATLHKRVVVLEWDLEEALKVPPRRAIQYPVRVAGVLRRLTIMEMLRMNPAVSEASIRGRLKSYGDEVPDWEDISGIGFLTPVDHNKPSPDVCTHKRFCRVYRYTTVAGKRYQIWWGGLAWSRDGHRAIISARQSEQVQAKWPDAVVVFVDINGRSIDMVA